MAFLQNFCLAKPGLVNNDFIKAEINKTKSTFLKGQEQDLQEDILRFLLRVFLGTKMSMLAEPRRRQKWALNPRGNLWSKDEDKLGNKMMEKMGWKTGTC